MSPESTKLAINQDNVYKENRVNITEPEGGARHL